MGNLRLCVLLWAATWAGVAVGDSTTPAPESVPDLILILLDGFRWDYLDIHNTDGFPGFEKIIDGGVRAQYLNPVYPPNSFPNWHTIVTGLYPESHGIVANYMYDDQRNATFSLDDLETTADPKWWQESEPLWITSIKAGMDAALFFWSRCDVPWDGVLPKYCVPYEGIPANTDFFVKNLNQAVDMIQQQEIKVAMVYEGAIDTQGHYYGPESPEVAEILRDVDLAIQGLWQELTSRSMLNTTNVVVLSDHGMAKTTRMDLHFLDIGPCLDYAQVTKTLEHEGYINILPTSGYTDQVLESLKNCPGVSENIEVVRKENMNERYHYKAHRLIHEIIVLPKAGFHLKTPETTYSVPEVEGSYNGHHGFDNTLGGYPEMRGVLFASGPSFVKGHQTGPVNQVDIYGLLCRALNLSCHPYNGTMDHVEEFFVRDTFSTSMFSFSFLFYSIVVAGLLMVVVSRRLG